MKNKVLIRFISLVFITLLIISNISAQVSSDIIYAIKTGNASKLITFFNGEVELAINEKEGIYNLAQAEAILKDFFSKNKPESFELKHDGTQGELNFIVGELLTSAGKYRTYIYSKIIKGEKQIYQLRFEQ